MGLNYHEFSEGINACTTIKDNYHKLTDLAARFRTDHRTSEAGEKLSDCADLSWSGVEDCEDLANEQVDRSKPDLSHHQQYAIDQLKKFPIQVDTKHFQICINHAQEYGYFESHKEGTDRAGGLWIEKNILIDYDGVYSLPVEVGAALVGLGFNLGDCTP